MAKNVKPEVLKTLESLKHWDLIVVTWLDSSSDRKKSGAIPGAGHDTVVVTPGFFLGVGGKIEPHIVLGRDIITTDDIIKYDNILLKTVERIEVMSRYPNPFATGKSSLKFIKCEKRRKTMFVE